MIKNYLKIAIRNISKNKLFSAINIAGMTIGMASFFIITLFVADEMRYDDFQPDKDRTYRIYDVRTGEDGTVMNLPIIPPVIAPTLERDFAQIESTLRIMATYGNVLVAVNEDTRFYQNDAIFAEQTVFDVLSIHLKEGNENEALSSPFEVVLSEQLAEAHFGGESAIGEIIKVNNREYTVVGVFSGIPRHSHLQTEMIMSFATMTKFWNEERLNSWVWQQFYTYVKFKSTDQAQEVAAQLPDFVKKYAHPVTEPVGFTYIPKLQRIDDIYLTSSSFEWEIAKRGNITTVYALSAAALFIIIIVAVNFINLSTARSLNRLKEVGIRKVIGAQKKDLIFQFLGESVLLSLISVFIAGLITELSLPYLNQYTDKSISAQFFAEPYLLIAMSLFAIVLGILAGSYPAFFVSSFKPLSVFGKSVKGKGSKSTFRKAAVIIQFTLSIFLISGAIIVYQQLNFLRSKDLGFNKEHVVLLPVKDNIESKLETIKTEWKKQPFIKSVSYSFGLPGQIVSGDEIRNEKNESFPANHFMVDYEYISTLQLEILAGRDFDKSYGSDPSSAFIINETAVKNLGYDSPEVAIGQELNWDMWDFEDSVKTGRIIGVVKDFHFKSLRDQLTTTVLQIYPQAIQLLALRIDENKTEEALLFLETTWKELEPTWPFTYEFLDESLTAMYKSERQLGNMLTFFTVLGIFIACLGLFGLVHYSTAQRIKEIGIRKVLGAGVADIVLLINKNFLVLMLIGLAIAAPVGYFIALSWLDNFAFRIEISPLVFVVAALVMIVFALITVSFQTFRAARTNPVETLKDE